MNFEMWGLPHPQAEYQFAKPRRWRFDYAWIDQRIACEIEGGTWVKGRHVRPAGYRNDCEKYNAAALLGWKVFRFTTDMVDDGTMIDTLRKVFGLEAL